MVHLSYLILLQEAVVSKHENFIFFQTKMDEVETNKTTSMFLVLTPSFRTRDINIHLAYLLIFIYNPYNKEYVMDNLLKSIY